MFVITTAQTGVSLPGARSTLRLEAFTSLGVAGVSNSSPQVSPPVSRINGRSNSNPDRVTDRNSFVDPGLARPIGALGMGGRVSPPVPVTYPGKTGSTRSGWKDLGGLSLTHATSLDLSPG